MMQNKDIAVPLISPKTGSNEASSYTWVGFAFLTAIFIGITNFFHGELSAKYSIAGSFPMF